MTKIPPATRSEMAAQPFYHRCARYDALHDHECRPNPLNPRKLIEWEHALVVAGRQVQLPFAIVPICWLTHSGPDLNKEINVWIALNRATDAEIDWLSSHGGRDYRRHRAWLNGNYGQYLPVENPVESAGINYGEAVDIGCAMAI